MKLSQLIDVLTADLKARGDTEHVSIGIVVAGEGGHRHRLDAVITADNYEIVRDANFVHGMACLVAEPQ